MADTKTKTNDNSRMAPGADTYEAVGFAKKYDLLPSEAKTIIKRYGPSRAKLDAHMKARSA